MHKSEHVDLPEARRRRLPAVAAGMVILTFACGSPEPARESAPAVSPAPAETAEGDRGGARRVFFVEPKSGATVKSPVRFVFGAEGIKVSPVPEGEVTTTRPDVGHHHLGVEQDCLPSGQEIVRGTQNWVHFGKGDTTFDLQLTPGTHKFALQMGDDLHRTIEGLCEAITLTVTE